MSGAVEGVDRNDLPHHEQMLDAQAGCVPCRLCGGSAIITDAGTGAGYYIHCGNSLSFRDYKGCLINERRLGGWAYNVMDWWNRLHAVTTPPARSYADGVAMACDRFEVAIDEGYPPPADKTTQCVHGQFGWEDCIACYDEALIAKIAAIRLLSQGGKA